MGGAWESGPPKTNPVPNPPAFNQIGGYEQLEAAYAQATPSRTIMATWYWCTDQVSTSIARPHLLPPGAGLGSILAARVPCGLGPCA